VIGTISQGRDIFRRVIAATCINGPRHEHLAAISTWPNGLDTGYLWHRAWGARGLDFHVKVFPKGKEGVYRFI
jgi:hypothetical protein